MFCSHCGSEIENGARFCQNCGASADATKNEEKMSYEPIDLTDTIAEKAKDEAAGSALGTGIAAIIFGLIVSLLNFIGIILGAVGIGKANAVEAQFGELPPKARVGKILSTVGLISGILMTIFWIFYIIFIVALAMEGYYYY